LGAIERVRFCEGLPMWSSGGLPPLDLFKFTNKQQNFAHFTK